MALAPPGGSVRRRLVKDNDVSRSATRTTQAAFKARERESPAARPHQRLHVQFLAVYALAAGFGMSAVLAAMRAADGDAPAERISLAYGLDSHENEKRTFSGAKSRVGSVSLCPHPRGESAFFGPHHVAVYISRAQRSMPEPTLHKMWRLVGLKVTCLKVRGSGTECLRRGMHHLLRDGIEARGAEDPAIPPTGSSGLGAREPVRPLPDGSTYAWRHSVWLC